jgi:signal transduction histidine kinase
MTDLSKLLQTSKRIEAGELDAKVNVDDLTFNAKEMGESLNNLGGGLSKAVDKSLRDERTKAELITNVSHDIKTPLTSIINYVNLLEDENITQEPAAGYIRTLDDKAKRLKQLLIDLIDASRLSSGTTEVNLQKIRVSELVNQIVAEFSDKLAERNLSVIFDGKSESYIMADGRHMWRLMDNLFENVCKYSLRGTRVYVEVRDFSSVSEGTQNDGVKDKLLISIKNISATPNKMQGSELTERFIRGDSSRTSEGSGLGLYIAKSLTELQGGTFEIIADGDLFKATMIFDISR